MPSSTRKGKVLKAGDGLYAVKQDTAKAPDKSKTYCVYNIETGDVNGRWHATKAKAKDQLEAMYANMGSKALKHSDVAKSYITPVKQFADPKDGITWVDDNGLWVQMYPYDTWTHPFYSDTTVNPEIASEMVKNFHSGVTGRKALTDYEHGLDPAKGGKASGEITNMETRSDGLYGLVRFNDIAKKEIEDGEWNYWSTTHFDEWTHPQTGETFSYVVDGGALTNKPYVRGMVPLNFSDVILENPELLVHKPVDEVDEEEVDDDDDNDTDDNDNEGGETVVADDDKPTLEAQLREKLGLGDDADILAHVVGMNDELTPLRELRKDHSDKKQFSEMYPEQAARLAKLEEESRATFAKSFSDAYAGARLTRKVSAGEDVKDEPTTMGLSALALEQVHTMAKEFSDGNPQLDTFKSVVDGILNNGIVDYGTKGSSNEGELDAELAAPKNFQDARKQFSDYVSKIQEDDKLDFNAAYYEAAKRNPELFTAYKEKKPVIAAINE